MSAAYPLRLAPDANLSDVQNVVTSRTNMGLGLANSPQFTGLSLVNSGGGAGLIIDGLAANSSYIQFNSTTTPKWQMGRNLASGDDHFRLHNYAGGNDAFKIDVTTNAFLIYQGLTLNSTLDVAGASTFVGAVNIKSESNGLFWNNAAGTFKWLAGVRTDITGNANDWVLYSASFGTVIQATLASGAISIAASLAVAGRTIVDTNNEVILRTYTLATLPAGNLRTVGSACYCSDAIAASNLTDKGRVLGNYGLTLGWNP